MSLEGHVVLIEVARRLSAFYAPLDIVAWMESPHPQLGGECPRDVVAAGRGEDVLAVIDRLEGGAYL